MIMNIRAVSKAVTTDFHSHCLPAMDDGARDEETSLMMLKLAAQQGVETVVATPHHKINQFFIVGQIAPIIYKTI